MVVFKLEDINDTPLKSAAVELGVPNAAGMNKPDLLREIRKRIGGDRALLLMPAGVGGPLPKRGVLGMITAAAGPLSVGAALATAILTAFIAYANVEAAKASSGLYEAEIVKMREATEKDITAKKDEKKASWQHTIVYKIIEDGMKTQWNGMTLDEIRGKYTTEAAAVKEVDLRKDDLDELTIRKIVIGLIESGLVYATVEDRYVVQKSIVNSKDELRRSLANNQVAYAVLNILARDSDAGKHTVQELGQIIMGTIKTTTLEEYNVVMAQLAAQKWILIVGEDKKVWSAANPPKPKNP